MIKISKSQKTKGEDTNSLPSFFHYIDKLIDSVEIVAVAFLLIVLGIVGFTVFTRYIFGFTFAWRTDLCRALLVWIVLLGSTPLVWRDGHVAVTEILERVMPVQGRKLRYVQLFLFICLFMFFTYYGYQYAIETTRVSPALGIRLKYVYMIMPIGGGLMLFAYVSRFLRMFYEEDEK